MAEQSIPHFQSHCCPHHFSLGHCLQYSAGQSPDDYNPYGMERSFPDSDCPLLYLVKVKYQRGGNEDVNMTIKIYRFKRNNSQLRMMASVYTLAVHYIEDIHSSLCKAMVNKMMT